MPNRFLALVSVVALGLFVKAAEGRSPINLDVLKRDGYGVVPLFQVRENVLTVNAVVNGHKVKLELDTGFGGGIGLDNRLSGINIATQGAAQKGYGVTGKAIETRRGVAQTVAMGNVQLTDVPVEVGAFKVWDEERSETFSSAMAFDNDIANQHSPAGFIGRDFLRTNSAIVDLANHLLYLRPPGTGKRAALSGALTKVGMGEAPILGGNRVEVELNGVPASMIVDTGAVASLLDSRFAAKVKARGYGSTNMEFHDIAGVKSRVDLTGMDHLTIAGIPARSSTATVQAFSFYSDSGGKIVGLLGIDFLGQNWSIIDFGSQKLYFARGK
jgi:hypothetical protein